MRSFCFAICVTWITHANQAISSEAGMPQLNTEYWAAQVFWLAVIFSVLYIIIWKIFLPRITYSIENRKSKLVNDLDQVQKLKENAEKKLNEYNLIIEKSKKEAKKIIEDSEKKLDRDIENKKKKFNEEIEKEVSAAENEIKDLKKSSISNINHIAVESTAEIIKQIVNTEINKSSVTAIVNDITKREMEKNT